MCYSELIAATPGWFGTETLPLKGKAAHMLALWEIWGREKTRVFKCQSASISSAA